VKKFRVETDDPHCYSDATKEVCAIVRENATLDTVHRFAVAGMSSRRYSIPPPISYVRFQVLTEANMKFSLLGCSAL
jgi:hypothetical protein